MKFPKYPWDVDDWWLERQKNQNIKYELAEELGKLLQYKPRGFEVPLVGGPWGGETRWFGPGPYCRISPNLVIYGTCIETGEDEAHLYELAFHPGGFIKWKYSGILEPPAQEITPP